MKLIRLFLSELYFLHLVLDIRLHFSIILTNPGLVIYCQCSKLEGTNVKKYLPVR